VDKLVLELTDTSGLGLGLGYGLRLGLGLKLGSKLGLGLGLGLGLSVRFTVRDKFRVRVRVIRLDRCTLDSLACLLFDVAGSSYPLVPPRKG
jgi:hypothetical protein